MASRLEQHLGSMQSGRQGRNHPGEDVIKTAGRPDELFTSHSQEHHTGYKRLVKQGGNRKQVSSPVSALIRVVPAARDAVLSRSLEPLSGSWESVCDELAASSRCQVGEGWSTGGRVIAAISGPWLFCFFCSSIELIR